MNTYNLDKLVYYKLDHLENIEDVKFIQTEIGKIRLRAEYSSHGKSISYLHKLANELEEQLQIKLQKGLIQ